MSGAAWPGAEPYRAAWPEPGNTILDGVRAFSSHNIWAVGEHDGKGGMRTLILHYTGGKN